MTDLYNLTQQSMADMDSWIAGQAGMEHDDEWTFFVPVARAALATYDEGERA